MATDSTTDSTTGEVATWQVITGSARGAAHRASGLPNQDAVTSQDGPGGVAVAIADGHGHIRHFRSADGAALAVDVACRVASQAAAGLAANATGDEEAERAGQELARAVVADWRTAVADQLEVRPYTVEEQFILARSADTPVIPYGSTLLVAVIVARWLVCAQIGDGDMLAVRPDGSSFSPRWRAMTGSTGGGRPACASRTRWRRSGLARTTCARCRWRRCCSPPTDTATPRPTSHGSPAWAGTWPSSPPATTVVGSGRRYRAGRSAAPPPRAATLRSRCCCPVLAKTVLAKTVLAKTVLAGTRKRAADVDGLIQPGDTLRMERAGALLAVEKRIGEGGQGVVHVARLNGAPFAVKWFAGLGSDEMRTSITALIQRGRRIPPSSGRSTWSAPGTCPDSAT